MYMKLRAFLPRETRLHIELWRCLFIMGYLSISNRLFHHIPELSLKKEAWPSWIQII